MAVQGFATFNDAQMRKFLSRIEKNFKHLLKSKQWAKLMSVTVDKDIEDHFRKQQGLKGPWKKWSERYRQHMENKGKGGNRILQDTSFLKNNRAPEDYKTGRNYIEWFNKAKTKKNFPYAYAHNEGGKILPRRKFMWLSAKASKKMISETLQWMQRGK